MPDIRTLHNSVSDVLDRVVFEKLWPGFIRVDFALYTSEKVWFKNDEIPWDKRFLGNTAIEYDGEFIAIWDVEHDFTHDGSEDAEILASQLVHEMFHAYQYKSGETRFPRDLVTLDYPNDIGNYALKFAENKLLAKAFFTEDAEEKAELLSQFCQIRRRREALIGDMCKCEYLSETAEGIAEFVGTLALRQICYEKYLARMAHYSEILSTLSDMLFDIRKISYYSGAVFLINALDAGIDFKHNISGQTKTVFEMIAEKAPSVNAAEIERDNRIEEMANLYQEKKKSKFIDFFKTERKETKGDFFITGYDPMNMIKVGNQILCTHFIRLTDTATQNAEFIFGPVVIDAVPGSAHLDGMKYMVSAYYV